MTMRQGDTIETETIDAGGYDQQGVKRQRGGNPLTGPFYVDQAKAGDVLAISLLKVSLNRNYAFTTEGFVGRSMPDSIIKQFGKKLSLVRWTLDRQGGFAWPDTAHKSYIHLRDFKIPLRPFLGCVGLAPANGKNEILSYFQGPFGGNLDFHLLTRGATIYLPVFHDGAYLYFGDGHALQGAGEIAGNALETSMDIAFSVRIIKNAPSMTSPLLEDSIWLMAIGIDKELDKALKIAGGSLLDWLLSEYELSLAESTQVLSTSIEYEIAEIADPYVEVVAKIRKDLLTSLRKKSTGIH